MRKLLALRPPCIGRSWQRLHRGTWGRERWTLPSATDFPRATHVRQEPRVRAASCSTGRSVVASVEGRANAGGSITETAEVAMVLQWTEGEYPSTHASTDRPRTRPLPRLPSSPRTFPDRRVGAPHLLQRTHAQPRLRPGRRDPPARQGGPYLRPRHSPAVARLAPSRNRWFDTRQPSRGRAPSIPGVTGRGARKPATIRRSYGDVSRPVTAAVREGRCRL